MWCIIFELLSSHQAVSRQLPGRYYQVIIWKCSSRQSYNSHQAVIKLSSCHSLCAAFSVLFSKWKVRIEKHGQFFDSFCFLRVTHFWVCLVGPGYVWDFEFDCFEKGSFNNYVNKEKGERVSRKSTGAHVTKGSQVVCKMSMFVHSRGEGGGQNWLKFGPRSCWMIPKLTEVWKMNFNAWALICHVHVESSFFLILFEACRSDLGSLFNKSNIFSRIMFWVILKFG